MTFKRYLSTESIIFNLLLAAVIIAYVYVSEAPYKFIAFGFVWFPINFFFFSLGTYYSIKEDKLIITDFLFKKTEIEWSKIKRIETMKQNRFSRFFLGSDEKSIKIIYNTYDEALLFPKNQQAFLSELQMHTNLENQPSKS